MIPEDMHKVADCQFLDGSISVEWQGCEAGGTPEAVAGRYKTAREAFTEHPDAIAVCPSCCPRVNDDLRVIHEDSCEREESMMLSCIRQVDEDMFWWEQEQTTKRMARLKELIEQPFSMRKPNRKEQIELLTKDIKKRLEDEIEDMKVLAIKWRLEIEE